MTIASLPNELFKFVKQNIPGQPRGLLDLQMPRFLPRPGGRSIPLIPRGMQYDHLSRDSMATVYDLTRIEGHFLTCWYCFSFLATF